MDTSFMLESITIISICLIIVCVLIKQTPTKHLFHHNHLFHLLFTFWLILQRLLPFRPIIITWNNVHRVSTYNYKVCTFATQGRHSSYEHFVIPCWLDPNHHATCERMWTHMGMKSTPWNHNLAIKPIELSGNL